MVHFRSRMNYKRIYSNKQMYIFHSKVFHSHIFCQWNLLCQENAKRLENLLDLPAHFRKNKWSLSKGKKYKGRKIEGRMFLVANTSR